MVSSMTGFGRGEAGKGGISVSVELRSVNSRFLEVTARLPRTLSLRENEVKELMRKSVNRGKITVIGLVERENDGDVPLRVNVPAARAYYRLLKDLQKAIKSRESIKLDHLLRFSDVLDQQELQGESDEAEWTLLQDALGIAMSEMVRMRNDEGGELKNDLEQRVHLLGEQIDQVEALSKKRVPEERERLKERIAQLVEGTAPDEGRLETEIALLADKLDVTEECVRFRSHNKFFLEAMNGPEPAGRKLNFLVQEMNREVNTIGSKTSSIEIAHLVVSMKEELEKIREQLQNVE